MKQKLKKIIIKIVIMAIISLIVLLTTTSEPDEKSQYLNHIDYNVTMNEDGSMRVTETWDINIKKTNTLFKTFNLSKSKYGEIRDVRVKDLKTNQNLEEIMTEMYHVPKNRFYGLKIDSHTFEIAWGTGMEKSKGNKKYEISYTVEDVVTNYKDCQEIYWQFLAKGQNSIPASKVTGTITLPKSTSDIDKIRVWGHGQLNGIIEKFNNDKVVFQMENLRPGSMLEIRVITEDKMFDVNNNKTRDYLYLNKALREETKWAQEANEESEKANSFYNICIIIYILIIIFYTFSSIKYKKILEKNDEGIKRTELKYCRDIPREQTATPGEATYLYNFNKNRLEAKDIQQKAISATILDLCFKRKIALKVIKEEVHVKILTDNTSDLNKDEEIIFKLLKKAGKKQEEFNIEELSKYAKKKYYDYSKDINGFVNASRNSLYNLKLINKSEEKLYIKSDSVKTKAMLLYNMYLFLIVNNIMSYIPYFRQNIIQQAGIELQNIITKLLILALPLVGVLLYKYKIQRKIGNKIAVLTQKGSDEKEQWKALARYMKNYSLLKEKEILDLVIWERYLIYATAFGISEKVLKEMKANYPQVFIKENWNEEEMKQKYPVIHFVYNPYYLDYNPNYNSIKTIDSINSNVSKAYKTSMSKVIAHSSSSSSGGGGGFSGGGGGRRRPVVGMGGR